MEIEPEGEAVNSLVNIPSNPNTYNNLEYGQLFTSVMFIIHKEVIIFDI